MCQNHTATAEGLPGATTRTPSGTTLPEETPLGSLTVSARPGPHYLEEVKITPNPTDCGNYFRWIPSTYLSWFESRGTMNRQSACWKLGFGMALIMLLVAGCGTGAYRERMEKRLAELRRGVPGQDELSEAVQIPNLPLELRVLKAFATELSPTAGSEHPARRQPPFPLPGLVRTWEAHLEQGGLKMPYYFYLGLVERSQNPQERIRERIHQEWPDAKVEWKDFPDAQQRSWKRCQVLLADLDWVPLDPAGKEAPVQKQTGRMDIFLLQEGNHWIIVACRAPEGLTTPLRRDDLYRVWLANVKMKS
jgi:hypothetical protein